ncbi:MAG: hypothetical protein ACOCXT_05805 [Candidatus Dojkabacteria bacterium]
MATAHQPHPMSTSYTHPSNNVYVERQKTHDISNFAAFWLGVVGVMVTLHEALEYYGEPLWLIPPGITACIFAGAVTLIATSGRNIGTEPPAPAMHRSPEQLIEEWSKQW